MEMILPLKYAKGKEIKSVAPIYSRHKHKVIKQIDYDELKRQFKIQGKNNQVGG